MSKHRIYIFISHSWNYSGHYDKLHSWIFDNNWSAGQASLHFSDYSVPKHDPIHDAPYDRTLQEAIYRKIDRSHIVICPTGMYANHSKRKAKEHRFERVRSDLVL